MCAPVRRLAPRYQTRQPDHHGRRAGQADRLRHRPHRKCRSDDGQCADRHAGLHGTRAIHRRRRGPPLRPLRLRRAAVPAADRPQAVRRRRRVGDVQGDERRPRVAQPDHRWCSRRWLRRCHPTCIGARSSQSFCVGGRVSSRLVAAARSKHWYTARQSPTCPRWCCESRLRQRGRPVRGSAPSLSTRHRAAVRPGA